jgi:hypothetical protein
VALVRQGREAGFPVIPIELDGLQTRSRRAHFGGFCSWSAASGRWRVELTSN